MAGDASAQGGPAERIGVADTASSQKGSDGVRDDARHRRRGLADRQRDHVLALRDQAVGRRHDVHRAERVDVGTAGCLRRRNVEHGSLINAGKR